MGIRIAGTGMFVPERILNNADLEKMVDTSDEWIISRTGIKERRIADADMATSDLAYHAARRALDMAGNVTEWVADSFAFDYYTHAPAQNPTGPDGVLDHGLRGGSWASPREQAQTFFRDSSHSVKPNDRVGFRCAQTGSG